MPRPLTCCATTLAALLSTIAWCDAQVFVVDGDDRPGTDFTTLQGAIDAVPDGAVLRVRRASEPYTPFVIDGRALTLLADEPGVPIDGNNVVTATAATQAVVLIGLRLTGAGAPPLLPSLQLYDCRGPIRLEQLTAIRAPAIFYVGVVSALFCDQLYLQRCRLNDLQITLGSAAVHDCKISGRTSIDRRSSAPAIQAVQTTLELSGGSRLIGGDAHRALGFSRASAAIQSWGSTVTVRDGELRGGIGSPASVYPLQAEAIDADTLSTVRLSPRAQLRPKASLPTTSLPSVSATQSGPGGSTSALVSAPPGELAALWLGAPAAPTPRPALAGAVWLGDPLAPQAIGVQQLGVPLTANAVIPSGTSWLGTTFAWQGATLAPASVTAQATNPVTLTVY